MAEIGSVVFGPEGMKRMEAVAGQLRLASEQMKGLKKQVEELEDAIRAHRAAKSPKEWSDKDAALYSMLPEVRATVAPMNDGQEGQK